MNDALLSPRSLNLLAQAKTIRHYEEALTRAHGEQFNLFEILQIGHYEVRTHSPILAELLNPTGTHGQGAVFLQEFLKQFDIRDFTADGAMVKKEVGVGENGRIDIVITNRSGTRRIFIENKIYAGLQPQQLERYQAHDPNAIVLFLTLNGDKPENTGLQAVPSLKLVSYRTEIVKWLQECRKHATTVPTVREAITHYLHLVQRLTQQNTNTNMNRELIESIIRNKESYLDYAYLKNADWEIRRNIFTRINEMVKSFAVENALEVFRDLKFDRSAYESCLLTTPALKAENLAFGIQCESKDYQACFFGFQHIREPHESRLTKPIIGEFKRNFLKSNSAPRWPAWSYWDQYRNWDDNMIAAAIEGHFQKDLKELLTKLTNIGATAVAHLKTTP